MDYCPTPRRLISARFRADFLMSERADFFEKFSIVTGRF
jgi:hypothetical protein